MSALPLLLICLVVIASTRLCNGACSYTVTIETGSKPGASAKAGVMMKLREGKRSTPWIIIHNKSGTNFLNNSKFKVSFDGVCLTTNPCVTLRMMTRKDRWFAKSLKIEVPDEHSEAIINDFQFDISHWVTTKGYKTCVVEKEAYVAFGRPM